LLGYLRMDYSTYSGIALPGKGSLPFIGQIKLNQGDQNARLSFLAPESNLIDRGLLALLDHLVWECGGRGALRLLAEIDEESPLLEMLRLSGFGIYGRQQVWRFATTIQPDGKEQPWRSFQPIDQHNLNSLYHTVVPPLMQSAEAIDKRPFRGFVYHVDGEMLAFVESLDGPKGVFLNPVVHPNIHEPEKIFSALLHFVNSSSSRPIYVAVRDYQSWLNSAAENLGGSPGSRKILLVRYLINHQRVNVPATIRKVLESHSTEPTSPIMQNTTLINEPSNDIIPSK